MGVTSFQKIYGLYSVELHKVEYIGNVEVMTDRQTDKQTEFQLVDSTPPVGGVEGKVAQ